MKKMTEPDCGWIKLHRRILDSKLWSFSDATFRVAVYLLLCANHRERYVRGLLVVRGQTIRSISRMADDCHLSKKAVRYAMQCLIDDGFIKKDEPFGAHQGHRITVCNYADYQSAEEDRGTPGAHAGNPAGNPEGNTNKKEKKEKKEKNGLCGPLFADTASADLPEDKPSAYGELGNVKLSASEHDKLIAKHGTVKTNAAIEVLDSYLGSCGKKYKSHYAVLKEGGWVWERVGTIKPARQENCI